MAFFEWQDTFLLGIDEFDKHHKRLVSLLNAVYDGHMAGTSKNELGLIIDKLIDYATYHFNCEEDWMNRTLYPYIAEHEVEHDQFTSKVVKFQTDFHSGKVKLSIDIMDFLLTWICNHILKIDAKYSKYFLSDNHTHMAGING